MEVPLFPGRVCSCVCVCVSVCLRGVCCAHRIWALDGGAGADEAVSRAVRWRILEEKTSHGVWVGEEAGHSR